MHRWYLWLLLGLGTLGVPGGRTLAEPAASLSAEPLFTRHIVPLFSRLGCNAGACHGAVQGKGGLRLSLFGADPEADHAQLVREAGGRRLNFLDPDQSLLLLKATSQVSHGGGKRLHQASPEYQLMRKWIAHRAPLDKQSLTRLTVSPSSHAAQVGESYQLRVEATFNDGSVEDVTRLCVFESRDPTVAEVDSDGRVRVIAAGDAALVARYRAQPVAAMLLVGATAKSPFPEVKAHNFIDQHLLNKLRRLAIPPAELCDDATFLRRVSLDVTGALPTPDEIRTFLADTQPDKRQRKIEELLGRPSYASLWATKFCDLLRPRISYEDFTQAPAPASIFRFHDWIRERLQENIRYDELVARILTATSLDGRSRQEWIEEAIQLASEEKRTPGDLKLYRNRRTLDLYWHRRDATGVKGTIQVAHAFLGLRLQCAECHRHPHDVWTQDDLLSFANFFNRIRANTGVLTPKEAREVMQKAGSGLTAEEKKQLAAKLGKDGAALTKMLDVSAVYHTNGNPFGWATATSTLGTQKSEHFRLLGDNSSIQVPDAQDPRQIVVAWLRRPDNPFFAKAIVNRVWAHYMGRGLVEPVDDMSPLNPPTHPELLQELARAFIGSNYDLKWLHRTILQSRAYQQSVRPHPSNPGEDRHYASFYRRRLPAEVLVDAINHATGGSEQYLSPYIPRGTRVVDLPGRLVDGIRTSIFVEHVFSVFGKPQRDPEMICDCERVSQPTLEQSLFVANHPDIVKKILNPQGRLAQVIKAHPDNNKRIDELYLWTLCRLPTEAERRVCLEHLAKAPSEQKGLEGLMWSLLNSSAFMFVY